MRYGKQVIPSGEVLGIIGEDSIHLSFHQSVDDTFRLNLEVHQFLDRYVVDQIQQIRETVEHFGVELRCKLH